MKKLLLIIFLTLTLNDAAALEITGIYIRGEAGISGKKISKPVKVTSPHLVIRVDGAPDGFCLERTTKTGNEVLCTGTEITGKILQPGTYTVFPSPPADKRRETVSVYLQPVLKKKTGK
ncbi:MAG: hypothetical protein H7844_09885 [Nitrospirae bacterium YQR-1]